MTWIPLAGWPARRKAWALAGVLAASAAALLATAPAAQAHATVVSTQPGDGSVLARPPAKVSVTFDEPVAIIVGSLRIYTPGGQRADSGAVTHTAPDAIQVALRGGLGHGTFTAAWRVVSADSHEVEGAFTFSIGAPSAHVGITQSSVSRAVSIGYWTVRSLAYGFYVALAGVVAFLIICWPEGARRKGVTRLIGAGWAGLLITSLLSLLFQGTYSTDKGIGALPDLGLLRSTLHSRIGTAIQAREVLVTVAALAASFIIARLPSAGSRARVAIGASWLVLAMGISGTWAGYDHSSTGSQVPLAFAVDAIHLTAVAIWCGGLLMLVTFVLRKPATQAAVPAVRQFSATALGCVAAIAATGAYEAWRQDSLNVNVFADTTHGVLLVIKTAGLACLVVLGFVARRYIGTGLPTVAAVKSQLASARAAMVETLEFAAGGVVGEAARTRAEPVGQAAVRLSAGLPGGAAASVGGVGVVAAAPSAVFAPANGGSGANGGAANGGGPANAAGPPDIPLRKLRRSVFAEVGLVTALLAISAALVNTATGRESYSQPTSATVQFSTASQLNTYQLHAVVAPALLGPNAVDLFLSTQAGKPYTPVQVAASLYFPARQIGPLPVNLVRVAPGQYHATKATPFTSTGQWQLRVTVRSDAFDETTVTIPVTVY